MRHIVSISGGKDSTALALRLQELNPDVPYEYMTTPTGNEPDEVFEHLDRLEAYLGPIKRLAPVYDPVAISTVVGYSQHSPGALGFGYDAKRKRLAVIVRGVRDGLADNINRNRMIPNFRARFCTAQLKIWPIIHYMQQRTPCRNYVGLRADEEDRVGLFGEWDGIEQECPFREWGWGIKEVLGYLDLRGIRVPRRTDCKWCFWQRLLDWKLLHRNDPDGYGDAVAIEEHYGHTFRSNGRDTWPAALYDLKLKFDEGHRVRGEEDYNQRTLFNCDMDDACRVCSL